MSPSQDSEKPAVVVGLVSCRNPSGLNKLLNALIGDITDLAYRILVVDNDLGGEALQAVEAFKAVHAEVDIRGVLESVPGIPAARNRLLAESMRERFSYIVMLDDDEYPVRGWLDALVNEAERSRAAVVGGPVEAQFERAPSEPVRAMDYAKPGGRQIGGNMLVESTANLLLRHDVVLAFDHDWFSEHFAATGGSDTEFLRRTHTRGFKHAVASAALVYEDIPASRMTVDWHRRRSYRKGNGLARTRILERGVVKAFLFEMANIAGILGRIAFTLLGGGFGSRSRFLALLDIDRARGKLAAFAGRVFEEYAREHYR